MRGEACISPRHPSALSTSANRSRSSSPQTWTVLSSSSWSFLLLDKKKYQTWNPSFMCCNVQSPSHRRQANNEIDLLYLLFNFFATNYLTSEGKQSAGKERGSTWRTPGMELAVFHPSHFCHKGEECSGTTCACSRYPVESRFSSSSRVFCLSTLPITLEVINHSCLGYQAACYRPACVCTLDQRRLLCVMKQYRYILRFSG